MQIKETHIGDIFSRLKVVGTRVEYIYRQNIVFADVVCECGNRKEVNLYSLKRGATKSCGCLQKEIAKRFNTIHGHAGNLSMTRTYNSWESMKSRCSNPKNKNYYLYGARDIKVCRRWMSFSNFLFDMGERPMGKTLDRIDNDKGYSKGNCRWSTPREQVLNRRTTKKRTAPSERRPFTRKEKTGYVITLELVRGSSKVNARKERT